MSRAGRQGECALAATADQVGIVLAGGRSLRFGADKAVATLLSGSTDQSERFADRALGLLRPLCGRLVLARTAPYPELPTGVIQVPDLVPGAGPLAALLHVFRRVPARVWLVSPCDMPCLEVLIYRRLLARIQSAPAAVAKTSRGQEPLVAVYSSRCADLLESSHLPPRSSMRDALRLLQPVEVPVREEEESWFVNVNRPSELTPAARRPRLHEENPL